MAAPCLPQALGSEIGLTGVTALPTLATEGFPTNNSRYVNLWVSITGFDSITVTMYLYHPQIGWVLDLSTTTLLKTSGGQLMEFDVRGAPRIYLRITSVVLVPPFVAGTVDVIAEGVTY